MEISGLAEVMKTTGLEMELAVDPRGLVWAGKNKK